MEDEEEEVEEICDHGQHKGQTQLCQADDGRQIKYGRNQKENDLSNQFRKLILHVNSQKKSYKKSMLIEQEHLSRRRRKCFLPDLIHYGQMSQRVNYPGSGG